MKKSVHYQKGLPRVLSEPVLSAVEGSRGIIHPQLLIILAVLGVVVYFLVSSTFPFKDKLFSLLYPKPKSQAGEVVRGVEGDLSADLVLGQPDFGQIIPGEITNFKVAAPGGVYVDRSVRPNRVYVYDGLNSRILGYNSLGVCANDSSKSCSSDSDCASSTCNIQVGGISGNKKADLVFGQGSFTTSACNGDGTLPQPASNKSMCSVEPGEKSPYEDGSAGTMATDSQGNLYVTDFLNHRVLKYNNPFATDTLADDVWGQNDFSGNLCNKGSAVSNSSLCFFNSSEKPHLGGVDIDFSGNLWVGDAANHRVLRFSKQPNGQIAKTADLVLGQINFTSTSPGSQLHKLHYPGPLRVDQSGRVFVADTWNNRVITFDNPTTNGVSGSEMVPGGYQPPSGDNFLLKWPLGLELDEVTTSDPTSGGIWVSDSGHNRLILFDQNGAAKKVLGKDTIQRNTGCGPNGSVCTSPFGAGACTFCDSSGSLGVTSDGDILLTASSAHQNIYLYKHPIPTPRPEIVYGPSNLFFSPPSGRNYFSDKGLISPRGLAVTNDQVIVADVRRILFWNIPNGPSDLAINKPADGYIGVASFTSEVSPDYGRISSDVLGNLWVTHGDKIEHYTIPVRTEQMPDFSAALSQFRFLGSSSPIGFTPEISDIEVDPQGRFFWLTDPLRDRTFRVRIPADKKNGIYYIDYMIGGSTFPSYSKAWGDPCPDPQALCWPGSVTLDKQTGNVYIADTSLEFFGDYKLFKFDASMFSLTENTTNSYLPSQASKTFRDLPTWKPAISNNDKLVVYYPAQIGHVNSRRLGVIDHISLQLGPVLNFTKFADDKFAAAYSMKFDSQNNLYVTDMNWGRILVYKDFDKVVDPPPTPPPAADLTSNLLMYYNFEEGTGATVVDKSQNLMTGTWGGTGVHWSQNGKIGKGAIFDGTTDFITINHDARFNSENFSISLWIKTSQYTDNSMLLSKWAGNCCEFPFELQLQNAVKPRLVTSVLGVMAVTDISATNPLHDDIWHHIVAVRDRSQGKLLLYVDGTLRSSAADTPGTSTNIDILNIGQRGNTGQKYKGEMDEALFYTRALSQSDVSALYSGSVPVFPTPTPTVTPTPIPTPTPTPSPLPSPTGGTETDILLKYKFTEGQGKIAKDTSGYGNHGNLINGVLWGPGRFNSGVLLDGIDDYIRTGYKFNPGNLDFTIMSWVKTTSTNNLQVILNDWSTLGTNDGITLHIGSSSGLACGAPNKAVFSIRDVGNAFTCVISNTLIGDNQWHHIAGVKKAGKLELYVDFILENTIPIGNLSLTPNADFRVGSSINKDYFKGSSDGVRIYRRALTKQEIIEAANIGN